MHHRKYVVFFLLLCATALHAQQPAKLQLKPGDHIAIIGNALPDRMQHSGYFETLLQTKFPQHSLVVRNLAAAGDEVVIRHRSENFGTPDEWLKRVQADVIFAFFGYNESFAGPAGLEKFKADLDRFLNETATRNYSAKARRASSCSRPPPTRSIRTQISLIQPRTMCASPTMSPPWRTWPGPTMCNSWICFARRSNSISIPRKRSSR